MALALAQYRKGAREACRHGYSAAFVIMCIGYESLCHLKGGLYICSSIGNLVVLTC
jgi:hypothetical protein